MLLYSYKVVQINYIIISELIYVIFLFNFKIDIINILNIISYYNFSCNQYLFIQPKYEAQRIPEAWPIADTCFPTQNIKRGVYLWQVVAGICFRFSAFKNRIIEVATAGGPFPSYI